MMHVLKRPVWILLPKPQVFLAAFLAAVLARPCTDLAGRWNVPAFWGWLAATFAGLWLSYFVERLYFLLRRRKS